MAYFEFPFDTNYGYTMNISKLSIGWYIIKSLSKIIGRMNSISKRRTCEITHV